MLAELMISFETILVELVGSVFVTPTELVILLLATVAESLDMF
jgi:hypothetical protein